MSSNFSILAQTIINENCYIKQQQISQIIDSLHQLHHVNWRRITLQFFMSSGYDMSMQKLQAEQTDQLTKLITVTETDFTESQQDQVKSIVAAGIFKLNTEKEISQYIKREIERVCQEKYNVIVGRHFGANLTATVEKYAYLQCGTLQVLLFKCQ